MMDNLDGRGTPCCQRNFMMICMYIHLYKERERERARERERERERERRNKKIDGA